MALYRCFALLLAGLPTLVSAAVPTAPKCVIPLTPALAEMVADLLVDESSKICGVTEYADRPRSLLKVANIGRYDRFSIEKLVSLKPDLVIASREDNSRDQIEHIQKLGVNVLITSTTNLEQIADTMRSVGAALGQSQRGERQSRAYLTALHAFKARGQYAKPQSVLLQLGEDPLIVAAGGSFLNAALQQVGAINTFQDLPASYPRISKELVLERQPEWILILALGKDRRAFQKMAQSWSAFKSLKAVQSGHVKILLADALLRPNASILEGLFILEKALRSVTTPETETP